MPSSFPPPPSWKARTVRRSSSSRTVWQNPEGRDRARSGRFYHSQRRAQSRYTSHHLRSAPCREWCKGHRRPAQGSIRKTRSRTGFRGTMSLTDPFVRRPIMTTLVMASILGAGLLAYTKLPVSDLPSVDFPTISISAGLPGASPETMASSVALPLEKEFSTIAGIESMTSTSSLGSSTITPPVRPRPQYRRRRTGRTGRDLAGPARPPDRHALAAFFPEGESRRAADPPHRRLFGLLPSARSMTSPTRSSVNVSPPSRAWPRWISTALKNSPFV